MAPQEKQAKEDEIQEESGRFVFAMQATCIRLGFRVLRFAVS